MEKLSCFEKSVVSYAKNKLHTEFATRNKYFRNKILITFQGLIDDITGRCVVVISLIRKCT